MRVKRQMLGWLCLLTLLFLLPACRADGQESPGTDLSAGSQVPTETEEQPPPAPVDRSTKIDICDLFSNHYFRWSTAAFSVGLHLGLSLTAGPYAPKNL